MSFLAAQDAVEHELFDVVESGPGPRARAWQRDFDFEVDDARAQDDDAIREHDGFVDVVGDEQRREGLFLPEALDEPLHADTRERVERAERLVEEQEPRLGEQRAGERDALFFPTR